MGKRVKNELNELKDMIDCFIAMRNNSVYIQELNQLDDEFGDTTPDDEDMWWEKKL